MLEKERERERTKKKIKGRLLLAYVRGGAEIC